MLIAWFYVYMSRFSAFTFTLILYREMDYTWEWRNTKFTYGTRIKINKSSK